MENMQNDNLVVQGDNLVVQENAVEEDEGDLLN